MKRMTAMLLITVLVLGLTGIPVQAGYLDIIMENNADVLDDRFVNSDFQYVLGVGANVLEIPLIPGGFEDRTLITPGTPALVSDMDGDLMGKMELIFTDGDTEALFRVTQNPYMPGSMDEPGFILTPTNIGPATGYIYIEFEDQFGGITESARIEINGQILDPTINKKITALSGRPLNHQDVDVRLNNTLIDAAEIEDLEEIRPGSELTFELDTEFFVWDPLLDEGTNASVRKSTLDLNQVGVSRKIAAGSALIDEVVIENIGGVAHVIVRFVDDFASVKAQRFELTVRLTYKGKAYDETGVVISGSLLNDSIDWNEYEYAYIGDGTVVKVDATSRNAQLDLGNGVSIYMTLYPGVDYYGKATDDPTTGDNAIMSYFPTIRSAITLHTVNIPERTTTVGFDLEYLHYIYDKDGELLGTSDELLPYRTKYYLSIEEIQFTPLDIPELIGEDAELEAELGDNNNDNPNTGTGSFAAFVGCAALLLGGSVVFKWKSARWDDCE